MQVREQSEDSLTPFTVSGDGATVRPFAADDLELIEEASIDPEIPRKTTIPVPFSVQEGAAFIERQHSRAASGFGWSMAIALSDRPIGQIGLWLANARYGCAELGCWIVASARGQVRAADAVSLVSEWAFDHLDVHRLGLSIEPANIALIRIAERAGYEQEALLRTWQVVDGLPRDMWSYGRLRS